MESFESLLNKYKDELAVNYRRIAAFPREALNDVGFMLKACCINNELIKYAPQELLSNKEMILQILASRKIRNFYDNGNDIVYQTCDEELQYDVDFTLQSITKYGVSFYCAPIEMIDSVDFIKAVLKEKGYCFGSIHKKYMGERELIDLALTNYGKAFRYILNSPLKEDDDLILKAVHTYPRALANASNKILRNRDLMKSIVEKSGKAYQYLGLRFRSDREFIDLALKTYPSMYEFIPLDLRKEKDIFMKMIFTKFMFLYVPSCILENKEIIMEVLDTYSKNLTLNENGTVNKEKSKDVLYMCKNIYTYFSEEFKADIDIIMHYLDFNKVFKDKETDEQKFSEKLKLILNKLDKYSPEKLNELLTRQPEIYKYLSNEKKNNKDIINKVLELQPEILKDLPSKYLKDIEIVKKSIMYGYGEGIKYLKTIIEESPKKYGDSIPLDIQEEALKTYPSWILEADDKLKSDENIINHVLDKKPELFKSIYKYIKDKEDFVLSVISKSSTIGLQLVELEKNNKKYMLEVLYCGNDILKDVSENLKDDKEFVQKSALVFGESCKNASVRLKDDRDVAYDAVLENGASIQYFSKNILDDDVIVDKCLKTTGKHMIDKISERLYKVYSDYIFVLDPLREYDFGKIFGSSSNISQVLEPALD